MMETVSSTTISPTTTALSPPHPISVVTTTLTTSPVEKKNDDDEIFNNSETTTLENDELLLNSFPEEEDEENDCNCGIFGNTIRTSPIKPKLVYDVTTNTNTTTTNEKDEKQQKIIGLEKLFFWKKKKKTTEEEKMKQQILELATTKKTATDDNIEKDNNSDSDSNSFVLSVPDAVSCPVLLTYDLFLELSSALPWSLQHRTWERCFCIARDGDSIQHMLRLCQSYHQTLLVVQTTKGEVFGAFCTGKWQPFCTRSQNNKTYYGNGQSFLFSCKNSNKDVTLYRWSGKNHYCQLCQVEQNRIAMGGEGDFGLILEDNFSRGRTGYCATYSNPPLVQENDGHFQIAALEIYGPRPFNLLF